MLAWYALQQYDDTGKFLADILNDADHSHDLSSQDRGLAMELSAGTLRRRRAIDVVLASRISRPRSNVEPDLWTLLQLATYQLVFARTPDHAAVDSFVELARQVGRPRWCGFANGILRNVARLLTDEETTAPSEKSVPLDGGRYRLLNEAIFKSPTADAVNYYGEAFSLPRPLARRFHQRFSQSQLPTVCFHCLSSPETTFRINRLKVDVGAVQRAWKESGIETLPASHDWAIRIDRSVEGQRVPRIVELPGYEEGWWSVQDDSAMQAAELLNPKPGESILDLCAAPGGKTAQLAELSGDQADILACDVAEHRLRKVDQTIERLGLSSIQTCLLGHPSSDLGDRKFDAVLADVPCSNTGVLGRRPEARWRFREADLVELTALQMKILLTAFEHTKPGGRIVYSTCSIEPEETSALIEAAIGAVNGLSCVDQQFQWPGYPSDGAYQALLVRGDT